MSRIGLTGLILIASISMVGCGAGESRVNDPSVGSGDTVTNPDEPGASDGSCDRTFVFHVQGDALATEVRVAGSFESVPWEGALELRDEDGDGFWQADVSLLPGTYEYRLIVDGTWSPDASNPEFVVNDFGDRNSVFEHVCPFAPVCITDAECGEDAPRSPPPSVPWPAAPPVQPAGRAHRPEPYVDPKRRAPPPTLHA